MRNNIIDNKNLQKILIIGANGFLGKNILLTRHKNKKLSQESTYIAADLQDNNIEEKIPFWFIDITNENDTFKKIMNLSPDIVILTAAMTNVDQNEREKDLATKINTNGPKNVLKACKKLDTKLIFLSTDFVFDGYKQGYYTEKDVPNPLCHYAKTKNDAELAIIQSEMDYIICRTAVLYGWNSEKFNFITWLIDKLEKNESVNLVKNQINNPTYVRNLSEIILKLIEKDVKGIYHTVGSEALNRYEMAIKCAEVFYLNKELISPIENFIQLAIRPTNAALDITKLKKILGSDVPIFSLLDGLKDMKKIRDLE
jgi:dTDP-4-dehydrorhamnose reductase